MPQTQERMFGKHRRRDLSPFPAHIMSESGERPPNIFFPFRGNGRLYWLSMQNLASVAVTAGGGGVGVIGA